MGRGQIWMGHDAKTQWLIRHLVFEPQFKLRMRADGPDSPSLSLSPAASHEAARVEVTAEVDRLAQPIARLLVMVAAGQADHLLDNTKAAVLLGRLLRDLARGGFEARGRLQCFDH